MKEEMKIKNKDKSCHTERRQFVNFKHLLKMKHLRKARKSQDNHSSIVSMVPTETDRGEVTKRMPFATSLFRLPLQAKAFEQINNSSLSKYSFSKCHNGMAFPLINPQKLQPQADHINCSVPGIHQKVKRGDRFEIVREIKVQRLRYAAEIKNKQKSELQLKDSQQNLPSRLNCRSISPLSDYGVYSQERLLEVNKNPKPKLPCRVSASMDKGSGRYRDISLCQFLYDGGFADHPGKSIEAKIQKIWRKKSKTSKGITFQS